MRYRSWSFVHFLVAIFLILHIPEPVIHILLGPPQAAIQVVQRLEPEPCVLLLLPLHYGAVLIHATVPVVLHSTTFVPPLAAALCFFMVSHRLVVNLACALDLEGKVESGVRGVMRWDTCE